MTEDTRDKKQTLRDRMGDSFRFSMTDMENLSELKSYTLTLRNFLTLIGGILVLVLFLYTLLIAFTPLKRLVPGYGDIEQNRKFIELRKKMIAIEKEVESQRLYNAGLRKILTGSQRGGRAAKSSIAEASTPPTTEKEILSAAHLKETSFAKLLDNLYFVPPVYGSISSSYDPSIGHYGVDILASKNTTIKSIARGVVIGSDWSTDSGNMITIQHPNNIITIYKHNSVLLKKVGSYVNAGEAIAIIGNSGTMSDGPHLHFEMWYDGAPVDPQNYISFK